MPARPSAAPSTAAAPTPCTSPLTTPALADGDHVVTIVAIDAAGNVDPTPAEDRWRVDTAGPAVTVVDRPSDPTSSASANLAWRSDEPADVHLRPRWTVRPRRCGAGHRWRAARWPG
jgi:hypothetical protein